MSAIHPERLACRPSTAPAPDSAAEPATSGRLDPARCPPASRAVHELAHLWKVEQPPVVTTVTWAAGNGDRSENGDYIYGKKRLREIDKQVQLSAASGVESEVAGRAGAV